MAKTADKSRDFYQTKVRGIIECNTCSALRCYYSNHCVGSRDSPTRSQQEDLEKEVENGYFCGKVIDENGFYLRRAIWCCDFIESHFYNPSKGLKGGCIETVYKCEICFSDTYLVTMEEIRSTCDMKGKNPLIVCYHCYDSGISIPTSGGQKHFIQKGQQEKAKKRKQLDQAAKGGRHKNRNS